MLDFRTSTSNSFLFKMATFNTEFGLQMAKKKKTVTCCTKGALSFMGHSLRDISLHYAPKKSPSFSR